MPLRKSNIGRPCNHFGGYGLRKPENCKYFHKGSCGLIIVGAYGKRAEESRRIREKSCLNESKTTCCYVCNQRKSCEICCRTLGDIGEGNLSGMILASNVISNPMTVNEIQSKYLIIYDQALTGMTFHNLNRAINIMARKGWKCINITSFNAAGKFLSTAVYMYALMEKL